MRLWIGLLLVVGLLSAAPKKTVAKPKKDIACVDTPRVVARKTPVKKLELSESMKKELSGVMFGVSLNERLELNIDMEAPTDEGATQLEKMVGVLAEAQQLKSMEGETVIIDLPKATRVSKNGKVVRTTVSLSDAQLEKLLEARYGRKLVSEAKLRLVYVHGLPGGTKSYPFGDSVNVDLRR
ncbi:MAG: hypothetical protein NTW74_22895 [Acidobacteria bacterium]|nr:hypothetical protein [Acidobacteriota bacterium]